MRTIVFTLMATPVPWLPVVHNAYNKVQLNYFSRATCPWVLIWVFDSLIFQMGNVTRFYVEF